MPAIPGHGDSITQPRCLGQKLQHR
jgi:hypothetical protein